MGWKENEDNFIRQDSNIVLEYGGDDGETIDLDEKPCSCTTHLLLPLLHDLTTAPQPP